MSIYSDFSTEELRKFRERDFQAAYVTEWGWQKNIVFGGGFFALLAAIGLILDHGLDLINSPLLIWGCVGGVLWHLDDKNKMHLQKQVRAIDFELDKRGEEYWKPSDDE